jgi:hypothetical protein
VPVAVVDAERLADVLDLPLASELGDYPVMSKPVDLRAWADVAGADLAAARSGELPATPVAVHRELRVADADGHVVSAAWRAEPGIDHVVEGDAAALGRALAWRVGQWELRAALAEALAGRDAATLAGEDDLDG